MADHSYERKVRDQRLTFLPQEEHQTSIASLSNKQLYLKHKRGVILSAKTRATPKAIVEHQAILS